MLDDRSRNYILVRTIISIIIKTMINGYNDGSYKGCMACDEMRHNVVVI